MATTKKYVDDNTSTEISWSKLKDTLQKDKARSLGYDNLPHTKTGKTTATTTDDGTTVTTTYNNDSTKIGVKKYRLPNNEIVSIIGKVSTNNTSANTKTRTTPVKSKSKINIDGVTSSVSTAVSTASATVMSSDKDYKKTSSGVVTNTSESAYKAAREAKKKRIEKEKAQEEVKSSVDVLKNEVPADIFELKQIVQMILDHLGITLTGESEVITSDNYEATMSELNANIKYLG